MSKGLICDGCGETLALNERGDDANGESSAWIVVETTYMKADACSRACAINVLNDEDFIANYEVGIEAVVAVTRTIKDEED